MVEVKLCDRCKTQAACAKVQEENGQDICIYCAPKVSLFYQNAPNISRNQALQREADARMLEALTF